MNSVVMFRQAQGSLFIHKPELMVPSNIARKPCLCWPGDIKEFTTAEGYRACSWPAKQDRGEFKTRLIEDDPVIVTIYKTYLEQRGRFMRHGELPRDSKPVDVETAVDVIKKADEFIATTPPKFVELVLLELHLCEKERYIPPPYRMNVVNA